MARGSAGTRAVHSHLVVAGAVAVLLFVIVPALSVAAAPRPASPAVLANCGGVQASSGISAEVTWNGVNVCSATTSSSALAVDFTNSANVTFSWTSTSTVTLTDARLAMNYFGFALATRDVAPIAPGPMTSGSFVMSWTPGALTFVLEGMYGITASLFAQNGSTVWSESFFVRATAPYSILAALPILLIVIGAYEIYALARSGRQAGLSRGGPPPAPPPSAPTTPAAPEPSPPSESAPTAEPPEGSSP
jgi:hypothetical protein